MKDLHLTLIDEKKTGALGYKTIVIHKFILTGKRKTGKKSYLDIQNIYDCVCTIKDDGINFMDVIRWSDIEHDISLGLYREVEAK